MSVNELIEYEDEDGDYIAVWVDTEDNTIVVQYNFVHLTLAPDNFRGFTEALSEAESVLDEELNFDESLEET